MEKNYVFAYTWTRRDFAFDLQKLPDYEYKTLWFNPRTGIISPFDSYRSTGIITFNPPGDEAPGNDWGLIL